jgi:hypothetical protein
MEFEASFARRLARLSSRHRAELRELLGNPPDPTNVPESFWQQVEQETREQSAVALYLLFLASGNYHASGDIAGEGLNSTASQLLNRQAEFYAGRRSSELAASYMATTRDRFGTLTDKLRRAAELETPLVRNEIEDDLTRIFGPDRAESVAVTETTGAQSAGGEAGTAITVGKSLEDQWVTEGDGKVCSICQPLHRTERPEWEKQFPDGPPAHVNCRCIIEYANKANAGGAAA